jgi:hypothetical protein
MPPVNLPLLPLSNIIDQFDSHTNQERLLLRLHECNNAPPSLRGAKSRSNALVCSPACTSTSSDYGFEIRIDLGNCKTDAARDWVVLDERPEWQMLAVVQALLTSLVNSLLVPFVAVLSWMPVSSAVDFKRELCQSRNHLRQMQCLARACTVPELIPI